MKYIVVSGQRFIKAGIAADHVTYGYIYGFLHQRFGFNDKGKPLMLKIEIHGSPDMFEQAYMHDPDYFRDFQLL